MNNYYEDAAEELRLAIENSHLLTVSSDSPLANQMVIEMYDMKHFGSEDNDKSNIELYLQFREYTLTDTENQPLEPKLRCLNLLLLNPSADTKWTLNMITRVWKNQYPDHVAIDESTGEVYLLFISKWGIELKHFARLNPVELQSVLENIDENNPYYIYILATAMFDVLDGSEGNNHLRKNLYISFKTNNRRFVLKQRSASENEV